jgi:hypothetical protein
MFTRSPPSSFISPFSSATRTTPQTQLYQQPPGLAATVSSDSVHSSVPTSKEKNKRHLLSETELELGTRNAGEILQLHEHLVDELRHEVAPLGFPMAANGAEGAHNADWQENAAVPPTECIEDAIRIVSTKFAVEVSVSSLFGI